MADLRVPTSATASATVSTDGVTIQGDGSSGNKIAIKQVETDGSLVGAGTIASTLKVVPATWFSFYGNLFNASQGSANTLFISGFTLITPLTFAHAAISIGTADNVNNSDCGVYNPAGTLIANAGAQHMGSTGVVGFAMLQGSQTIVPGNYIFAFTSVGTTIRIGLDSNHLAWTTAASFSSSSGGALPASITPPAVSAAINPQCFALY